MIIEQIWTNNAWRNFNYLIACPETGDALAIDPLNYQQSLNLAKKHGWKITKVLNTHEHHDHIEGNKPIIEATGADLLAHNGAHGAIPNIDTPLSGGEVITVGKSVELEVIDTPGHTMSHVCLLSKTPTPVLFSGDTLFNAGVGHCHAGGDPEVLAQTVLTQMAALPDSTLLYPGHDYIVNNLRFTLDREPGNQVAQTLLKQVESQDPNQALITNLGVEREINTFFRTDSAEVIENLPQLASSASQREVFLALRECRNCW